MSIDKSIDTIIESTGNPISIQKEVLDTPKNTAMEIVSDHDKYQMNNPKDLAGDGLGKKIGKSRKEKYSCEGDYQPLAQLRKMAGG